MLVVTGTSGNDTITPGFTSLGVVGAPTGFDELIRGSLGADLINGGGGFDTLDYSGLTFLGAPLAIFVSAAGTVLKSSTDTDTVAGIERIVAGSGNDTIIGLAGTAALPEVWPNTVYFFADLGLGQNRFDGGGRHENVLDFFGWNLSLHIDLSANIAFGTGVFDDLVNVSAVRAGNFVCTVTGSNFDDLFFTGQSGSIWIGNGGVDSLSFAYATAPLVLNVTAGTGSHGGFTDLFSGITNFQGTAFADSMVGSAGAAFSAYFTGGAGNDTINGNGNPKNFADYSDAPAGIVASFITHTVSDGFGGTDTLQNLYSILGSNFADTFRPSLGDDTLDGLGASPGSFDLVDYSVEPLITGVSFGFTSAFNAVATKFSAGQPQGTDALFDIYAVNGTAFADTLTGSALDGPVTILRGGAGNDVINGAGNLRNLASYSTSTAAITANLQNAGGIGNYTGTAQDGLGGTDILLNLRGIIGSNFSDNITGSAANDIFGGSLGADSLDGGSGINTIDYSFYGGAITATYGAPLPGLFAGPRATVVKAVPFTNPPSTQTDTLTRISDLRGSNFADRLNGITASYSFYTINLAGGAGNDTINGQGNALNCADYSIASAAVNVNLASGLAQDGQGGTDTLINVVHVRASGQLGDTLIGGVADDTFDLLPGSGNTTINGAGGRNTVRYDGTDAINLVIGGAAVAGSPTTLLALSSGVVTLFGLNGAIGGGGNDSILGSAGDDTLGGGAGNNRIDGSAGTNWVTYASFTESSGLPFQGVVVDLLHGTATNPWGGTDTLLNIQNVLGSSSNDTIYAGTGNATFDGGGGQDVIIANIGFRGTNRINNTDGSTNVNNIFGTDRLFQIEQMNFVDGRLVFDGSDPAAQIVRLYQAALHRAPDQGGLNNWIDSMSHGAPLNSLAAGFIGSQEFTNLYGVNLSNSSFVTALYANALGRAPDPGGLASWVNALNGGMSRADVLVGFSESAENKANTAAAVQLGIWDRDEVAGQVARLYDAVLRRLPDIGGLTNWKNFIESGQITLAQASDGFTGSPEFQSIYGTLNDSQFVTALYNNALHRAPDAPGLASWVNALSIHTLTRSGVVLGFSESQEHINNTADNVQSENPTHFGILFI